jgi:uncharacterized protein YjbJ (UPF0337 family)
MNWDRIEGQWKQRRGKATHHWGRLMNDELAAIAGRYELLVGRLQEKYGMAKEDAEIQIDKFKKTIEDLKKSNSRLIRLQRSIHKNNQSGRKSIRRTKVSRNRR